MYGMGIDDQGWEIILLLGLAIFTILHHYFPKNRKLLLLEGIYAGGFSLFDPRFAVVFALPIFEGIYHLKPLYLIPGGLLVVMGGGGNLQGVLIASFAILMGSLFHIAHRERGYYREESDRERRKRYEVEKVHREFLSLREEVYHMGELMERNRIAQELHDDVGHELTGAVLSLQALTTILEEYDLAPEEMKRFEEMQERVNRGAKSLREAVYRLKPYRSIGIDEIKGIVEEFHRLPIDMKLYGSPDRVPVHYWVLLKIAVKEGLTNVIRHSDPREIKLQIDVTPSIVRFELENDGIIDDDTDEVTEGIGLRNLRLRARAYGGSFTAAKLLRKHRFRLVLVLPLREEFHEREH